MSQEEVKAKMKKRKPPFRRQDCHKRTSLAQVWRKPKGLHSKMRLRKKGYNVSVKNGYRTPVALRGCTPAGLKIVHITTLSQLEQAKGTAVIISGKLGAKKRIVLFEKAKELSIQVLHHKNPDEYIARVKKQRAQKKEAKENKKLKQKEKQKKAKKSTEKVKEEKTKEEEKKERDKILTKKDK